MSPDAAVPANKTPEKLNNLARCAQPPPESREREREREARETLKTPTQPAWDTEPARHHDAPSIRHEAPSVRRGSQSTTHRHDSHPAPSIHSHDHYSDRNSRSRVQPSQASQNSQGRDRERQQKYSVDSRQHTLDPRQHARKDSDATGGAHSSADYSEPQQSHGRRHDYDVQSMETSIIPRNFPKNPIPAPTVTVRSEFPTLNRSRQQQSLTCLVTVEVVDGKWRPDPEDIRSPSLPAESVDSMSQPRSPARPNPPVDIPREHPDVLARVSEDLRTGVDNWHGLDFSRFGSLVLYGTIRVGKDRQSWQDLQCYLFTEMLICIKEKKVVHQQPWDSMPDTPKVKSKCTLKGSILIKRHLKHVEFVPGKHAYAYPSKLTLANQADLRYRT